MQYNEANLIADVCALILFMDPFVPQVHERQWQIDVLLVSLRRLIDGPRPDLKVLLMSATLDTRYGLARLEIPLESC
jgi:hypothetical protein